MGRLDKETFDREVELIRRTYGGDRRWRDTATLFADYLYWRVREPDHEEENPDLELILRELIDLSLTNKYMWDAVNLIAQEHLTRSDPLPVPLAEWTEHVLVDQYIQLQHEKLRPRPRKGRRTGVRDRMMCLAIESLVARGYTQMRSGGGGIASAEGGTACDIVGKAFNTGYKNAEKIWTSRPPQPSSNKNPTDLRGETFGGRPGSR